jgi:type I restriction enzyme S subunit
VVVEWRDSTWGAEISLEYGKALRGYESARGLHRVYGANGPIGWTDDVLAQGPGVILGRKGAYRGIEYSHDPFFVIDTAYYAEPKTDLDMRWLYYAMRHHRLGEIDDGSPIPSTTRAAVYKRSLMVPPKGEQLGISRILGSLDDKIKLNERLISTLTEIAREVFRAQFIGPRTEDGRQGWRHGVLLDLCELKRGFDLPASKRELGKIPVVSSSGISGYHSVAKVKGPSVVTGRYGTLGQVHYISGACWPLNTSLYVCDFKGNSPRVVWLMLKQIKFESYSDKAAVPGVNRNHLHQAQVMLPPVELQVAFEELLHPIWAREDLAVAENETLSALRDTLLPKLMSGELRVPDAEKQVREVL